MARVLVPLPEGFEEIEAVTVVDLLRRAGIEVRTASLAGRQVTGSHGIRIEADITIDAVDAADAAVPVPPRDEGRPGPPVPQHRHAPPRYEVLLRYGVRHEPWVAEVRPLP